MKLLLGIGGGEDAFHALERTIDRVRETGDDLTVVVFESSATDPNTDEVEASVRDTLEDADVGADVRRASGDAGSQLTELAESEEFDRIVLGGGERSPMGKIRLGPTVEFVLLNAETSVTLIR